MKSTMWLICSILWGVWAFVVLVQGEIERAVPIIAVGVGFLILHELEEKP